MKTVLAPIDFSEVSQNACFYAAGLALSLEAELALLHVYNLPITTGEIPAIIPAPPIDDIMEKIDELKEKLESRFAGLKVTAQILQGDVITAIDNCCRQVSPLFIVMGGETKTYMERLLVGGKTIEAVRTLHWPVIAVPREAVFNNFKRIGLACDYKDLVNSVPVDEIIALVERFGSQLHVLHIGPGSWDELDTAMITEASWLRRRLENLKPVYDFVRDSIVEEGINRFAQEKQLDLLVIIPKKHSLLNRILQHSHSRQVLLHTSVPVLSMRHRGAKAGMNPLL